MNARETLHLIKEGDGNGQGFVVAENNEVDIEVLDDESEDDGRITAVTVVKTLPTDVTLIVQNNSYTLEILESYKRIISEEMRTILQNEGHRSPNFRKYGQILRNITTAIKLKTDFIRDLFRKLTKATPESISKTSYATIVHYQKSLFDYQVFFILNRHIGPPIPGGNADLFRQFIDTIGSSSSVTA